MKRTYLNVYETRSDCGGGIIGRSEITTGAEDVRTHFLRTIARRSTDIHKKWCKQIIALRTSDGQFDGAIGRGTQSRHNFPRDGRNGTAITCIAAPRNLLGLREPVLRSPSLRFPQYSATEQSTGLVCQRIPHTYSFLLAIVILETVIVSPFMSPVMLTGIPASFGSAPRSWLAML